MSAELAKNLIPCVLPLGAVPTLLSILFISGPRQKIDALKAQVGTRFIHSLRDTVQIHSSPAYSNIARTAANDNMETLLEWQASD